MAPSPTIPTSFVPKQPVKSAARFTRSGGNVFMMLALIILGVSVVGAAGTFIFQQYLNTVKNTKAAAITEAQKSVNPESVEDFVRFRERFSSAAAILNTHVAASHFFDLLEQKTLNGVRFNSLTFEHVTDGSAKISLTGSARSFNALAAQSGLFTTEKQIKRAIFADIKADQNGSVSFNLTAELDPSLIEFTAPSAPQPSEASVPTAPPASSTPSMPSVEVNQPPATTTP